jgi:hypothetical protein
MEHVWSWSMDQCRSSISFRDLYMIHLYWCGYMILLVWQDKHDIEQTTIINVEITTLWSKEVPLTLHRSDCWKWKPLPAKEPCAYSAWHSMSLFLIGALSYPLRALATGKGLSMSSRFTPFDCAWAFCLQMPPWAPRGWVRRYFSPQPSDANSCIHPNMEEHHYDHWAFTILIISRYLKFLKSWLCGSLMHD